MSFFQLLHRVVVKRVRLAGDGRGRGAGSNLEIRGSGAVDVRLQLGTALAYGRQDDFGGFAVGFIEGNFSKVVGAGTATANPMLIS